MCVTWKLCYFVNEVGSRLSDGVPAVNSFRIWKEIFKVMSVGRSTVCDRGLPPCPLPLGVVLLK